MEEHFFSRHFSAEKSQKTAKGKETKDDLKGFYLLKSDARCVQYFIYNSDSDTYKENTPDNLKACVGALDADKIFTKKTMDFARRGTWGRWLNSHHICYTGEKSSLRNTL